MAAQICSADAFYGSAHPRPYLVKHVEHAGETSLVIDVYTNPTTRESRPSGPQQFLLEWAGRVPWQMGGVAEVRPPVAPRRPKSAYFIFADAERAEVKRALPDLAKSVTGMSKELGRRWKALPEDRRAEYERIAKEKKTAFYADGHRASSLKASKKATKAKGPRKGKAPRHPAKADAQSKAKKTKKIKKNKNKKMGKKSKKTSILKRIVNKVMGRREDADEARTPKHTARRGRMAGAGRTETRTPPATLAVEHPPTPNAPLKRARHADAVRRSPRRKTRLNEMLG